MSAYGSYYETHVVDTLISSQNGSMTLVDSTISRNVFGNYDQPTNSLRSSLCLGNECRRTLGIFCWGRVYLLDYPINLRTFITLCRIYEQLSRIWILCWQSNNHTFESETYKNPMTWGANIYVPLGINFRLGTKRAFWKPWMFYSELRPQLSIQFNS
jgi:hypothetical protein